MTINDAFKAACNQVIKTTQAAGNYSYQAIINTPWAIDYTVSGIGRGFKWTGQTIANTLEGAGNAALWTLKGVGRVVSVTSGTLAVTVGYPIAVVGLTIGIAVSILSVGPCWAASHTPGIIDRVFTPVESTARLADATLCPPLMAASGILLTLGILGLVLGKLGKSAFK